MRKLFSVAVFVATGLCTQWASAQTAALQNTTAVRGNASNVQRALNSRARLLERANAQTRGQVDTRANGNALGVRADVSARANVNGNANINATGIGLGRGNGTLLPPAAAGRLPQAVMRQRLETTVRNDVRGRTRSDVQIRTRDARERRRDPQPERTRPERDRGETQQTRAEVLSQTELRASTSPAHRLLVMRLAQIDKMRDTALANGNERQLEQADRLEQLARWQFANRFAARANNPFAEVSGQGMTETNGEIDPVRHPFRPESRPAPGNRLGTVRTQTELEMETTTAVSVDSQN